MTRIGALKKARNAAALDRDKFKVVAWRGEFYRGMCLIASERRNGRGRSRTLDVVVAGRTWARAAEMFARHFAPVKEQR